MLDLVGFRAARATGTSPKAAHHVFTYDWRRDLVESARRLHATLEELADRGRRRRARQPGRPQHGRPGRALLPALRDRRARSRPARHLGGRALHPQPDPRRRPQRRQPARARGPALRQPRRALVHDPGGARDRAHAVRLPAAAAGGHAERCSTRRWHPSRCDLHDIETWKSFGWGPFGAEDGDAPGGLHRERPRGATRRSWRRRSRARAAVPRRARRVPDDALPRPRARCSAATACPRWPAASCREKDGKGPRFEPRTRREAERDDGGRRRPRHAREPAGRRTCRRAEDARRRAAASRRSSYVFFGSADHHGIYREPTFQSILLRLLLKPLRVPLSAGA